MPSLPKKFKTAQKPAAEELVDAAYEGRLDKIRRLLKRGVDINEADENERTALHYAVDRKNLPIVLFLLRSGANVNCRAVGHETPLMRASKMNNEEMVRLLADHGAEINAKDISGWTPLMYAVINEDVSTVRFLLSQNADIGIETKCHQTVFDFANSRHQYHGKATMVNRVNILLLLQEQKEQLRLINDPRLQRAMPVPRLLKPGRSLNS